MAGYVQSNQVILLPDLAGSLINAADTGKIMITPATAVGCLYVLPAFAAGLHFRFINGAPGALAAAIVIASTAANTIYGSVIMGPTGGVALLALNGNTNVSFVNGVSLKGDYIDLYCDGTNWYVEARSRVLGGIV